jgi:hypothetical protein
VPAGPVTLQLVPAETRLMDLVVKGEVEHRFRTPVCLAMPAGWLCAGIRQWLGIAGELVVVVDGAPADPNRLLVDVVGAATSLVLGPAS